jgi:hypothetical protein
MSREDLLKEALFLINKHGITAYEIEKNTSLTAVGVQKIINGESKRPLENTLNTIISYIKQNYTNDNSILKEEPEIIKEEKGKIPYYDVDFAGGWSTEELFTNAMPAYYISAPEFAKSEFACNLRGNSISNRIKSGAIIGLKEISDWEIYFPTNELYAVITKNDLRTVKIVKWGKDKKYLELIPDPLPEFNNPPYETETIPVDFVSKMFQVVAWGYYERLVV